MEEDNFYLKIAYALSGCQLVEQELKLYITEALELVTKCINDKMPFNMRGEDYANSSLERLIDTFKKLTENEQLVKELNTFKKKRNDLSHIGITRCLDYEGELCHSTATELQGQLEAIQSEATQLRLAIHEEANKFRGHLWFDDLTKDS